MERATIAGLVVMGGEARRMGGGDKALIALGGRSILAHALDAFRPQVGLVALSANGDPARLAGFALPVLADPPGGPGGPLAGVLAGLAWAAATPSVGHLATIPGDAPQPPADLVARLAGAGGALAVATLGGQIEPLHALWPLAALEPLRVLVAEGVASPRRALERLGAKQVRFDDPAGFRDVDTPADLAAAAERFDA